MWTAVAHGLSGRAGNREKEWNEESNDRLIADWAESKHCGGAFFGPSLAQRAALKKDNAAVKARLET